VSDEIRRVSADEKRPIKTGQVRLIRDLETLPDELRRGAVSIGNFDGVHLGHARIVERLLAAARRVGGASVIFTFDPLPAQLLHPQTAPIPLCRTKGKAELLGALGVDAVVAYPTDQALLRLEADVFFERIIRRRFDARAMVEGPNFFFGRNRSGTIERLRQLCTDAGVDLEVVEPREIDGQIVSSSRLRTLVATGRLDLARSLLGRPYRLNGTVIRGAGRGASLGYPTANIAAIDTLLPGEGIYAGRAWMGDTPYTAAVSVGPNPTFNEKAQKVEVYLIGYRGSLYDQVIAVDFFARLRDIERFDSADELIKQMDRDVAATRQIVEQYDQTR